MRAADRFLKAAFAAAFLVGCNPWLDSANASHIDGLGSVCDNRGSMAQKAACYEDDRKAADTELNAFYAKVIASLDPAERTALVASQRIWITYRDRFCAAEKLVYSRKPQAHLIEKACVAALTRQKTEALKDAFWSRMAEQVDASSAVSNGRDGDEQALFNKLRSNSEPDSSIAVRRIPGTQILISYVRDRSSCGSGGCRAEVWRKVGQGFADLGHLSLGHLPIVRLPSVTGTMPDLGVTIYTPGEAGFIETIVPQRFNGKAYRQVDAELPAGRGEIILSNDDLVDVVP